MYEPIEGFGLRVSSNVELYRQPVVMADSGTIVAGSVRLINCGSFAGFPLSVITRFSFVSKLFGMAVVQMHIRAESEGPFQNAHKFFVDS